MSNSSLLTGRRTSKPLGMRIVDVDTHISDPPTALAPYCEMPWRRSLEQIAKGRHGYVDIPGYAPGGLKQNPPVPGGHRRLHVPNRTEMREELDLLGIDDAILLPDNLLQFASLSNPDYANALARAYNRWLIAEWMEEGNGLHGALMAIPQDPEESVREIERYVGTPGIRALFLPTAGVYPLWGHRKYFPIMRAAEEADLPVILHSVGHVGTAFPHQQEQFENDFGRWVINHTFGMQANLASLMHTGIPARFPKIKIVFTEAGIAWVPLMMMRMDRRYKEARRDVPFFDMLPSEYMQRNMYFGTQPFEEPSVPEHYAEMVQHYFGEENTIFCSDWPHHDFDHPNSILDLPLSVDLKRKIMGENAAKLFKLPALQRQTV